MAGLSPIALAALWSVAMAVATLVAAVILEPRVAPEPEARIGLFLGVEGIAMLFVVAMVLACFVWPEPFGIDATDLMPMMVVLFTYALLSGGLSVWLVVLPAMRAKRGDGDGPQPPSSTVLR